MKNNIRFCLLLLGTIFLVSCETDFNTVSVENTESADLLKYKSLFRMDKPDGSVVLQSNAVGRGERTLRKVFMSQKGDDKKLEVQSENRNIITFRNYEENKELSKLFGKKLIINKLNNRNPPDSLYIPEELVVNFPSTDFEAGTTVSWNVDSQNLNGLVVFISYDPLLQLDTHLAWNNQYLIEEVFALEEGNGSYTITQQNIDRFPEGAMLDVRILRGAYAASVNNEPAFVAFSMVSNDVIVR